ncbi:MULTISPECIES: hypothetical protein [Bacillus cereus group]|uniref:Uncharacterized protein n=1 Tax=Bacillus thuringiensis serovar mexicanensis TaxID=180868 RepID=A0A242WAM8_BACTU|nr:MULTISPECIES: hypothetical protein [Bacillus cereus group]EEM56016.1 hypothetical protein bthur0007_61250 [Bacillus thuringiensis serovar monterrey BGSC 4AJ1]MEB9673917.1 hypothetical protein [Bacillus anthracis]OTW50898.1 hypothetical protein BK699_10160 [Bacillus thuringiensis serovar mexicanensis]OTX09583.1 hypothetical protein BK705_05205 [Bacillus thuringiensis serovar monterrey]
MEHVGGLIYWLKKDNTLSIAQCPNEDLATTNDFDNLIMYEEKHFAHGHNPLVSGNDLIQLQDAAYRWDEMKQQYQYQSISGLKNVKSVIFNNDLTIPVGNIMNEDTQNTYSDSIVCFRKLKPYPVLGQFINPQNQLMIVSSINGITGIALPLYEEMSLLEVTYAYYQKNDNSY